MLRSISILVVIIWGVTPAAAQSLERAEGAYFRGDYALAMRLMQPLAEQGDEHAQYLVGFMYDRGQGVSEDPAKAAKWYSLAAKRGHPHAQNNLGVLYKNGRGVPKDYVQAYQWFDLAASGYLPAEFGHRERAILNQQDIASQMTPDEISEAKELAKKFRDSDEGSLEYRPPRVR